MEKQKKQLIGLLIILIVAVAAFILVSKLPDEDTDEEKAVYAVTSLNKEDVTKLKFTNGNGTVTLTKNGESWLCEEDRTVDIDEDTVDTMAGKVASLTSENKIENVEDISRYGLDSPSLTILVSDGTDTKTILVGDYNETTYTYYLCLEGDTGTVYTAQSSTVSDFMNKTLEDLAAEEETTETRTATESDASH